MGYGRVNIPGGTLQAKAEKTGSTSIGYQAGQTVTISGLGFSSPPTTIYVCCSYGNEKHYYILGNETNLPFLFTQGTFQGEYHSWNQRVSVDTITSDGFRVNNYVGFGLTSSYTVSWKAIQ